ncbi:hypothetical protein SteCoe_28704 [Stentor coeruleus]|uniref:Uncharacterized protein n=1 Tax=Stentor coeruleus TaxID=5963 RepID=A0A1R2B808_9CILI|nr:hypothetical protein SteCoe_28704 [Stentor coeruleus]
MEFYSCQYDYCQEEPEFICVCNNHNSAYCKKHLNIHIAKGDDHDVIPNYTEISLKDKEIFSIQCTISLRKLESIQLKILEFGQEKLNKINQLIKEELENVLKTESIIRKAIGFVYKKQKIVKKINLSEEEKFINRYLKTPKNLIEDLKNKENKIWSEFGMLEDFKVIIEENATLKKEIEKMSNLLNEKNEQIIKLANESVKNNLLFEANKLEYREKQYKGDDNFESTEMCFFKYDSNNLYIINIFSGNDSVLNLNTSEKFGGHPAFCQISEKKIFIHGGYTSEYLSSSHIVDLENKKIEKKANNICRTNIGQMSLYNGNIYVFGGTHDKVLSFSYKYSLNLNKWEQIASLPNPSRSNCTILDDEKIILSGFQLSSVLVYDISKNSYSFFGNVEPNNHKFICKSDKNLYVFEGNKLYESLLKPQLSFSITNLSIYLNSEMRSFSIRNKQCVYILLDDLKIYVFNLATKEMSILRSVKIQ